MGAQDSSDADVSSFLCSLATRKPIIGNSSSTTPGSKSEGSGFGIAIYGVLLVGGLVAFGAYQYMQNQSQ